MLVEQLSHGPAQGALAYWIGTASLWVFSAAVSALTPPRAGAGTTYRWLYRFLHFLAANLDRAGVAPAFAGADEQPGKTN